MKNKFQRGASLVELTVVLPTLTATVLGVWQSALVFHAKSHLNYATFEAARAGSVSNATVASVTQGLAKGLVAYYGGGLDTAELAERYGKVSSDLARGARVEFISPIRESFDDYDSPQVRQRLKVQARAIPNLGIGHMACPHDRPGCASDPRTNRSGQTLSDANLLKLRITYGIPTSKQLPLVGRIYTWALDAVGAGSGDAFKQQLLDDGRIPVVSHVTVRMQSEPIENAAMVSRPGSATPGEPRDPGTTPPPADHPPVHAPAPPEPLPVENPGAGDPHDNDNPPAVCPAGQDITEELPADVLFEFDSATLTAAGRRHLDTVIQDAHERDFDSLHLAGHTDPLGSADYNDRLSLQRANAVRNYLLANGFPDRPITAVGRGSSEPLVDLSSCPQEREAQIRCLQQNRRVSLTWQR
jgi:outer membrane protein OmpA-like peptidoglycan-associated protein